MSVSSKKALLIAAFALLFQGIMSAQYKDGQAPAEEKPAVLTLEDALKVALSENVSVKVADKEITRAQYAKKGSYAALFPSIDGSASYQRTIKKQVMYMDGGGFDMSSMIGDALLGYLMPLYAQHPGVMPPVPEKPDPSEETSSSNEGFSVGRWNTWSTGVSASMPIVNFQLWESLKISGQDVELAVEKARASRLEMVTQVKQAFFAVLLAKESRSVFQEVFENAVKNFEKTEMRYKAQKASELDYARAKSTVQNAIPNLYNAESQVALALWQLKAVMGVDLDENIDVAGTLADYSTRMLADIHENDDFTLDGNSNIRQLAIQLEELAGAVRMQKYATLPSLAVSFSYMMNAMANDFKFSTYQWSPYSFVGLSLQIPIFAGGRRHNAIRQAQVQYDEVYLQKANAERQLQIAIRQYLNQMETSMKTVESAESAVETAEKAYGIAEMSYQVGRSTITELNDAQLALTQARLGVSQAIYNFIVAKANLEQTLGADFTE
ncbi:MAG: TolC family protein [Bacteroidales bacterium]|nr:TolC family protein [Bacteroidales bacterium]